MSYYGFIAGIIVAFILWSAGLDWLGLVFIFIGFVSLFYQRTKKEYKKISADVKKTEGFYPEKKFMETYPKGAAKTLADNLMPQNNTEVNVKGWVHKSQQMASNFFKEIDELFK
ncbi:MAG: hypothetical protein WCI04_05410 [archaeon]